MRTDWDYTELADAYGKRPGYAPAVLDACLHAAAVRPGMRVCDVGAGPGTLTVPLLERGLHVVALEPNDAMRRLGSARTAGRARVTWHEARGEATAQPSAAFALVIYGSSFNVTRRRQALREAARILRPRGWFACLWNHRDLDDPLQREIERLIHAEIDGYRYGARREDQTPVIAASGLFHRIQRLQGRVVHRVPRGDFLDAWRAHATLRRQAGDKLEHILGRIRTLLRDDAAPDVAVPYTTQLWMAERLD